MSCADGQDRQTPAAAEQEGQPEELQSDSDPEFAASIEGLPEIDPRTVKVRTVEVQPTDPLRAVSYGQELSDAFKEHLPICAKDGRPYDLVIRFDEREPRTEEDSFATDGLLNGTILFHEPDNPVAAGKADLKIRLLHARGLRSYSYMQAGAMGLLLSGDQSIGEGLVRGVCLNVFKRAPNLELNLGPKAAN